MAGGTWDTQNKKYPGVYIRFRSTGGLSLNVGDRGTVAICEPLSWGPVAQVMEIAAGADMTPYTGYDITNTKNRFLNEMFKGTNRTPAPNKVLLYRPTASSSAEASAKIAPLTATAKYPGARGNDITVIVTALATPADTFLVSTVVDGMVVDEQQAETVEDLVANDWVTFSGTGALAANAGTPLTGGADGTVQAAAYSTFLTAIGGMKFDVLVYDGEESTVLDAYQAFVKRMVNDYGKYAQLVAAGMTNPNSQFVINVGSGVTLSDGAVLTPQQVTWWAGGATAGAKYNQDLTYAQYPGAVTASTEEGDSATGNFVLFAEDGVVKVEYDVDSLVSFTPDVGEFFRYNRVMRLCNTIANDIYKQFSDNYIGVVDNNEAGRMLFRGAIVGYLSTIQANSGIQNFEADDVEVLPGEAIDAIVVKLAIQPVMATTKIYMTIELN